MILQDDGTAILPSPGDMIFVCECTKGGKLTGFSGMETTKFIKCQCGKEYKLELVK